MNVKYKTELHYENVFLLTIMYLSVTRCVDCCILLYFVLCVS